MKRNSFLKLERKRKSVTFIFFFTLQSPLASLFISSILVVYAKKKAIESGQKFYDLFTRKTCQRQMFSFFFSTTARHSLVHTRRVCKLRCRHGVQFYPTSTYFEKSIFCSLHFGILCYQMMWSFWVLKTSKNVKSTIFITPRYEVMRVKHARYCQQ